MTIPEFLVLLRDTCRRTKIQFEINDEGLLRTKGCQPSACPLQFVSGVRLVSHCAQQLGLSLDDAWAIAQAADVGSPANPKFPRIVSRIVSLQEALLVHVGLLKPKKASKAHQRGSRGSRRSR